MTSQGVIRAAETTGSGGGSAAAERGQTAHELRRTLGVRLEIVVAGGVDTPATALTVLEAGDDAVGYFIAFITRGPAFPGSAVRGSMRSTGAGSDALPISAHAPEPRTRSGGWVPSSPSRH
jgi:dihydroorotate dehydrogenase